MLTGVVKENGEKTAIGLTAKKQLCTCMQHLFLYISVFAVVSHDRNVKLRTRNLLVTRFMEEALYVFLFTFFSTAADFQLGGR